MPDYQQHQGGERVVLVSVSVQILEDLDAEEFHLLAKSAGAEVLQHVFAQRIKPDAKLFIGSGKADEIAALVAELEAELVIFDHALTPAQARNLEKIMKCRVVDRTELILDIFAQRARTYEGKLQVELAQLHHLSSRLIRSRGNLDSQKGGIGLRGPGETLLETDRRLLQIIHQQCVRTNGIVESVLGLARRERAMPEQLELVAAVRRFIADFHLTLAPENGSLQQAGRDRPLEAVFDPRHLQQILTVLVQNAINHGRLPGEIARVTVAVEVREGRPAIEVTDRGPGIPEAVASQIGRPFFTTSEYGTGLGLYIARELAKANGATLDYVSVPGGGACFRITLRGGSVMLG